MSSTSRGFGRQQLERDICREDHRVLLERLQQKHTLFRSFDDWAEVVAFMRQGTSRDPAKDGVLLPIFAAHALDPNPRWRTILFVIFWPALNSILRQKRHWDRDLESLWANVYWAFLKTICRLDPARRRVRLTQKVINDTIHHLYDDYRKAWDDADSQSATDPDELARIHMIGDEWDAVADLRDEQAARIKHLKDQRDAGRLGGADFLLLVGMHVYGRSITDCAQQAGLTYEAAKKRAQRSLKAIGGFPQYEA